MKAKNFLFTAVLTFGAILFATNVSAQIGKAVAGTATTGGTIGNVELVLKLSDFQELNVNAATSRVEFTFNSKEAYRDSGPAVATALDQLTVFSTKKFNITVAATDFKVGDVKLPPAVLALFQVQATNNVPVTDGDVKGKVVTLSGTPQNLFTASQNKTKVATGYNIDIDYSLTNPSDILSAIGDLVTETKLGTEDIYTSTVTYTIIPG